MKSRRWRKGVILLQTLVMSVILSMIAVMVLKWVLGRYMLAARTYRSAKTASHSEGYDGRVTSSWNLGASPGSGNLTIDGQTVSFTVGAISNGSSPVVYTSDADTITN